ncbi:WxL domain-containing protein [Vagococcus zengguangii]|uniref:WxL domain-containing protein n=1 Tax=Vagococcus zengguangii TaxID=2571750 RepID=A0A4D7CR54_9ENTE|nr:WxL domain-containing protein [Vagococcus zengguangii]QCI85473.1 WxL domain-containing protein [Vagococcus zengguangii]TLG80018.1 WxL domain-containing protein [Vagococcus zengguangii]
MKYTKLLSTAVLGAMTLGMVTPAFAEVEPAVGEGRIEFTADTSPEGVIDPENPGTGVTPEEPGEGVKPGKEGPLQIVWVSNLKFGSMPASLTGIDVDAAATNVGTKTEPILRGNFVQIADKRFDKDPGQGWTLSAQMTKQFTEVVSETEDVTNYGNSVLNGSTITYKNANIEKSSNQDVIEMPTTASEDPVLSLEGGSKEMMSAAQGQGFGNWAVEYGDSRANTEATSVHLNVPTRVAMKATNYKAEITWTLSELDTPLEP